MNKTVRRAVLRSRANSEYHSKYRKPLVTAVEHNKHNREVTNSSSCAAIDIKDENYSAIHEVAKIKESEYVCKIVLTDNHRHSAIADVLKLLTGY